MSRQLQRRQAAQASSWGAGEGGERDNNFKHKKREGKTAKKFTKIFRPDCGPLTLIFCGLL